MIRHQTAAHATSNSAALEWEKSPQTSKNGERRIFETCDVFDPDQFHPRPRPPPLDPRTGEPMVGWKPQGQDDYLIAMPFDINLPVGVSTTWKDGATVHQPSPMPPSFEANLETWQEDSASAAPREKSRMRLVKDAVTTIDSVRQWGVWYTISFEIRSGKAPPPGEPVPEWKSKHKVKADQMRIPIVFLGEAGNLRPGPQMLPPILSPKFLLKPEARICEGWACHTGKTTWAKPNWPVFKRGLTVDVSCRCLDSRACAD